MEQTRWRKNVSNATFRHLLKTVVTVSLAGAIGCGFSPAATAGTETAKRHTRDYFRNEMVRTIRPDHPAIVPLAAAIRAVTTVPLQQLVMVNDITHLLVDYDDDERVYGTSEFHATFDEMLARRREAGWLYLRDDCDGRAVFAAHLLSALGIPWRLEASFWKEHAWIVAKVGRVEYDLLDLRKNAPETDRASYKVFGRFFVRPSNPPPAFAWRRAWADRTGRNLALGQQLGILTLDSTRDRMRERYATDWTVRSPGGRVSPVENRVIAAATAGFPFGEPINVGALAGTPIPTAKPATGTALGTATGSGASATDSPDAAKKTAGAE